VQAGHRYAVAWPSTHPDTGRPYRWLDPEGNPTTTAPKVTDLPELPPGWVAAFDRGPASDVRYDPAADSEVETFLDRHTDAARPELLDMRVSRFRQAVAAGTSRHDTAVTQVVGALEEAAAGLYPARAAHDRLRDAFLESTEGDRRRWPEHEYAEMVRWSVPRAEAADADTTRARVAANVPPSRFDGYAAEANKDTTADERRAALAALLDDISTWQYVSDPAHILVALGAAATRNDHQEPCWLLIVAAASAGKTETVRMLDYAADEHLDEVTSAGLLGWSKGKTAKPTGVLSRIGDRALVTFGDLSTLLATSDKGGRDAVFALLRRAYDGAASRDVSPPGRTEGEHARLAWEGRLTVVAAVTGAIDRYTAHADQLGPRWVYVRLPAFGTAEKRAASRMTRGRNISKDRARVREAAARLVATATHHLPNTLPEHVLDAIEDAALVTCWGRAGVPRSGYGRREILDVASIEEPMRVVQQITAIARGLSGLGLGDDAVTALARRVALDSMPASRHGVLSALSTGELLSTTGVAKAAGIDRKVARFTLEELEAIGVVESDRADEDAEDASGVVTWALAGDDGALVADVFAAHRRCGGWDKRWLLSPVPPKKGKRHRD
jgi:hypothetical protein